MVIMDDKIPKLAERTVIEEYYNFYQIVNYNKGLLPKRRTFSIDSEKLMGRDLNDNSLLDAIETVQNETDNFKFLLVYDDNKYLSAVARLKFNEDNIHMCEIIFTNYPNILEKLTSINDVINYLNKLGIEYDVDNISLELLNSEVSLISFVNGAGFSNDSHDEYKYQTTIFTKDIRKKDLDGPSFSRKQARRFYKS